MKNKLLQVLKIVLSILAVIALTCLWILTPRLPPKTDYENRQDYIQCVKDNVEIADAVLRTLRYEDKKISEKIEKALLPCKYPPTP